ncbi:MAG: PQQ-binding-like beta-propeller repeat protein [Armatimonadota bacterium]
MLCGNIVWAQLTMRWMYTHDFAQRHDFGRAVQLDSVGNVYVTGFSRSAAGDYDILVLKLDLSGAPLWYVRYGGSAGGDDKADHIVIDESRQQLYVAGVSVGATPDDYILLAYSMQTGQLLWERRFWNIGENSMQGGGIAAITLDPAGNIYVTGAVWNGYDYDATTLKYDPNGNLLWEYTDMSYTGAPFYAGLALAYRNNALYVLQGDWNTGAGFGADIVCLNAETGAEQWRVNLYRGTLTIAADLQLDSEGNLAVLSTLRVGTNHDLALAKVSPTGQVLWTRTHHVGARDFAVRLLVDEANRLYACGTVLVSGQWENCIVVAYNAEGNRLWATQFNRANLPDLLIDAAYHSGRLYLTSWSQGSPANFDLAVIELDTTGAIRSWVAYNGTGNHWDGSYGITAASCQRVYVVGGTDVSGNGTNADLLVAMYQSGRPEDVNRDGCVDDADLLRVLFAFGQTGSNLPEDVNCDGVVDDADLLTVLFNFGGGC